MIRQPFRRAALAQFSPRPFPIQVKACLVALMVAPLLGCVPSTRPLPDLSRGQTLVPSASHAPDVERRVVAFCGDCHALPRPDSFSRDRWFDAVRKGYEIYGKSGRTDLDPPPFHQTLAFYRAQAPEELVFPAPPEANERSPFRFAQENLGLPTVNVLPEIAHLQWAQLAADQSPTLVACDMRYGQVMAIDLTRTERTRPRQLALLRNPCRVEICDLDADGATDLVVADLGSFMPAEHDRGRVVWLRYHSGKAEYEVTELAGGLGRVADVRAADVDGDQRLDLIVAEFGWQRTGRILLLHNTSTSGELPRFEVRPIDDRPGTIHVPIHDVNADGRPDFVALISQEYEAVDLFENVGEGRFHRRNLWAGPDLTFGSTGLEWVDFDRDGDRDILYTNGDAFDDRIASPWHGVQWLENQGGLAFAYHRLTDMPGACRALAADFDGDGDEDVVAAAFLPRRVEPSSLRGSEQPSIVMLEQTARGQFQRYTLERGSPNYATLALGDFDHDGDPDFAVASGPTVAEERQDNRFLTVWWNERQ